MKKVHTVTTTISFGSSTEIGLTLSFRFNFSLPFLLARPVNAIQPNKNIDLYLIMNSNSSDPFITECLLEDSRKNCRTIVIRHQSTRVQFQHVSVP